MDGVGMVAQRVKGQSLWREDAKLPESLLPGA